MAKNEINQRRNQARALVKAENDLKIRKALISIRDLYSNRIRKNFDPGLSAKLDALTWLLEEVD